jgi:voltage-gated sodium channel
MSRLTINDLDEQIHDEEGVAIGASNVLGEMGVEEKKPFVGVIADSLPCGRGLYLKVVRLAEGIGVNEAPQRDDRVSRFMRTSYWNFLVYAVIIASCVFMAYATNEAVQRYDDGPSSFVVTGEFVFMGIFTVEMALRLWRDRLHYFYDVNFHFNWLDLFVLGLMYYFNFISDQIPNMAWLRILRMLRLVKVLRVFRLIIMFKTLRAILLSLATTVGTFLWSMLLLTIVFFVFALVFVQGVAIYFRDEGPSLDQEVFTRLDNTYGSIKKAMISLYMCTTGGHDWAICYDPMALTGQVNQFLFLVFVAFTQIAVLNIILGIFVDNAMKRLMIEKEEAAYEHAIEEKKSEDALRVLCVNIDSDKDGRITERELQTAGVTSYLDLMGFQLHNVLEYFRVLSRSHGGRGTDDSVDINMFVRGFMRLKGLASCFDMQVLRCEVQEVYVALSEHKKMSTQLLSEMARLQRAVDARDAGN